MTVNGNGISTLDIRKQIEIEASPAVVFESLFEAIGPPDLKLEPRVGGRWFRDLGGDEGHLWGHVQVIKPPTLLEIWGPMFMSYAAAGHVQFRLTEMESRTRLALIHRALGMIPDEDIEGITSGWEWSLGQVRKLAELRAGGARV